MSGSITTGELALRIEDPAQTPFILDVRAPDQFDRWRIEGKIELETINIPYWTALENLTPVGEQIPDGKDVIVVCGHGGSSGMVAELMGLPHLRNLEGGMDAWANTLVSRTLLDDGTHFVIQFDRIAKACLSYAVGARGGTMAIIDPAADIPTYLAVAEAMGATITDVFDTHLHADHISLARRMAAEVDGVYHLSAGDGEGATYEFAPLRDGEVFTFGNMDLVVRSVATPGHTPGSTSLEVADRFLMTGDAVFVSGIGRPDLGGKTEPWARDLFHTINDKLAPLSGDLEVCPAHYSSRAESREDGTVRRDLADLLANDPVVSIVDEEEFVSYVVSHLGDPPEVYAEIRRVNLGLSSPDHNAAKELEVGRNECALGA